MAQDVPIIEARALHKAYGRTTALRGASVAIGRAEVAAMTGPPARCNASLLLCQAGVAQPEAGEVTYA